jgi:hypothetical protein
VILDENKGVGGSEIDADVAGEESEEIFDHDGWALLKVKIG